MFRRKRGAAGTDGGRFAQQVWPTRMMLAGAKRRIICSEGVPEPVEDRIIAWLWCAVVLASPFYALPSGLPQAADWIMLVLVLFCYLRGESRWGT
ncbi:MAG: hypothetical protein AAB403_16110, partial [Planctomycetota bacterium]